MQMIAWLRDHKTMGVRYASDNTDHGLVASCDASNKPDPHYAKCQRSYGIGTQWMGGAIGMGNVKNKYTGYSSPASRCLAIREAASRVCKFRNVYMFFELRLHEVIREPIKIYVESGAEPVKK